MLFFNSLSNVFHDFLRSSIIIRLKLYNTVFFLDLPNKSGQIAVITGGARGIGVEVVKMLMQCDMRVIIGR